MSQGYTEPYLCNADDNKTYVVKSSNTLCSGLVKEWIVAHLGVAFDLPIPPFKIAWLDDVLLEYSNYGIEPGFCFASEYQANIQEITFHQLGFTPGELLRNLYVFDYWIKNNDRNLTKCGGNPNFFYNQVNHQPIVLDHNLSFDTDFDIGKHRFSHVGKSEWRGLDLIDREFYELKFENSMKVIDNAITQIPEDWLENYSLDRIDSEIINVLNEYKLDAFWRGLSL